MKEIVINGRFITKPPTGVQRYAWEIIKAIDTLLEQKIINTKKFSITLMTPRSAQSAANFRHIRVKKMGALKGNLWEQFELSYYARNKLLVNLCNTGPLLKTQQVVTIHDAAAFAHPENYSRLFRAWYHSLLPHLGKRARSIITVSNFSKEELYKFCGIPKHKIKVIYEGANHLTQLTDAASLLDKHRIKKDSYVLAVSTITRNKNFDLIIKAIEQLKDLGIKLVVVGNINNKVFKRTPLYSSPQIIYAGFVSDSELKTFYQNALSLIYPSTYEGFGLPPVEAMSLGCPVIVSKSASLPEVCQDGALYLDDKNPQSIADLVKRLFSDQNYRNQLIEKGKKIAEKYSWEKCAQKLLNHLNEIL